jgi:hypothetical protein
MDEDRSSSVQLSAFVAFRPIHLYQILFNQPRLSDLLFSPLSKELNLLYFTRHQIASSIDRISRLSPEHLWFDVNMVQVFAVPSALDTPSVCDVPILTTPKFSSLPSESHWKQASLSLSCWHS